MEKLCDRLLEMCNKSVEPSKNHSMDKLCRGLVRLTSMRLVRVHPCSGEPAAGLFLFIRRGKATAMGVGDGQSSTKMPVTSGLVFL